MEQSDFQKLLDKDARRRGMRIAGISLLGLSGVLLILTIVFTHPAKPQAVAVVPKAVPDTYADINLSAKAAVVYDLKTGQVLYSKNEAVQLPLASITKLLTIYAAVDTLPAQTPVVITHQALAQDGDNGLVEGETFAFQNLARFALVASSNDAAEAIAEATASRQAISSSQLLANAASAAGLSETYALNGTGLDVNAEVAGAYGSAKDVAVLAGSLLQKAPLIAQATIEPSITTTATSGKSVTAKNTNPDVANVPGLLMSKTGYTDLAGGNLVIIFDAGLAHPVAISVLGSTRDARFTDVNALLSATLAHFAASNI
jgi:D-alanyl-D-alanine carboxypeptidase